MLSLVLLMVVTQAQAPPLEVLGRLREHCARLERLQKQGSMTVSSKFEELDSDGAVTHTRESVVKVSRQAGKEQRSVVHETEDGKDVTAEAQKRADERKGKGFELALPFAAAEEEKYRFIPLAADPARPELLRIGFEPRLDKSDKLMMGEALVDPVLGEVVHVTMRASKGGTFIDHLLVDLEFGATTAVGRAASRAEVQGDGSFLFIKKRFRGVTLITDQRLNP